MACRKLSRKIFKPQLIANDISCLRTAIKTAAKKLQNCKIFILFAVWLLCWNDSLQKLRRSTFAKMPKRKHEIGRIYRSGNEKIKAAKESEIKLVGVAIKKFIVERNSTEIEESEMSHSFPWRIKICAISLDLLYNLLHNIHHLLPWASNCFRFREKNHGTEVSVIENCEVAAFWLGPNAFQQLSEILYSRKVHIS